jgi:hypothetical protein
MSNHFVRFLAVVLICWSAYAQETQAPVSQAPSSPTTTDSVPHLIRFHGTVKDVSGKPVGGVLSITFALYAEENGGAALWMETQNVQADASGHYSVSLGATASLGIPGDIFTSGEARWLGVQPDGQAEQPRVLLLSVPYALKAGDAATIGGLPPSAFVRANSQSSASSDGGEPALNTVPEAVSANTLKNVQTSGGKTSFLPLWTSATTVADSILSQSGSDVTLSGNLFLQKGNLNASEGQVLGRTGFFQGNSEGSVLTGYSTSNTSGEGVSGVAEGTSGIGVDGSGVTGVQGLGLGSNSTGVVGQGGIGVLGNAPATTGSTTGVLGKISSSTQFAAAVEGVALGNGPTSAVEGINLSNSDFAAGVVGSVDTIGGTTFGVEGLSGSPNGTGVIGFGAGSSQTGQNFQGCCAFGVWGDTGSQVPTSAALMGTADVARAMFLENNSTSVPTAFIQQNATGTDAVALVAGGGQQQNSCSINALGQIACPNLMTPMAVDSGARQVALYAMESPQNWFEDFGSGQLANGRAAISLDPIFSQTLNTSADYHVFVTPKGDCRGLYVSKTTAAGFEVHELAGGQSSVAFDYRIVALRRGFENVRMEDLTRRLAVATASMPKGKSGGRPIPRPVLPARLATDAGVASTTAATR